jgi:hypothetical protein
MDKPTSAAAQSAHPDAAQHPCLSQRGAAAAVDGLDAVDAVLNQYAARGVFQDYRRKRRKNGTGEYNFGWLYAQPFTLTCNLRHKRLVLVDLLPGVQRDSLMHKEIKAFLKGRAEAGVPDHRRVDPQVMTALARMRDGLVSLELTLEAEDCDAYALGARKIINLAHELFLFMNEYWADYMWQTFRLGME